MTNDGTAKERRTRMAGRRVDGATLVVAFIIAGALMMTMSWGRQESEPAVAGDHPATTGTTGTEDDVVRGLVTKTEAATPGYVLFSPLLSTTTYLIDLDGRVVHTWESDYSPGGGLYLLDNGHLLRTARDSTITAFKAGGVGGLIEEFTWDGELVWQWGLDADDRVLHHDIEPLPNGNVLSLGWEVKTPAEAIAAGRRPEEIPEQGLWPDFVVEIAKAPPTGGTIVWEWHVWDHLVQRLDPTRAGFGDPSAYPGRLDVNGDGELREVDDEELAQLKAIGYVPDDAEKKDLDADFLHLNAVAYNPDLDQIALSSPELGEIWIIDHSTTTAEAATAAGGRSGHGGELLYRWGNPRTYWRGTAADKKLFYQHDVRWLTDPESGDVHLTIFNNGGHRPDGDWSEVFEIKLPVDGRGGYILEDGRPFGPAEPTWTYRAEDRESFFAPFISGAERIDNGHTMICSGPDGRFFEIDHDGAIVWEYLNPYTGDAKLADGTSPQPGLDKRPYATFRATKIPADHPALVGRGLGE